MHNQSCSSYEKATTKQKDAQGHNRLTKVNCRKEGVMECEHGWPSKAGGDRCAEPSRLRGGSRFDNSQDCAGDHDETEQAPRRQREDEREQRGRVLFEKTLRCNER
jgi:hypothetical protein